jgi:putative oxidoreductase
MRGIWGIGPGWGLTAVRVAMALVFIHAGWLKWFQFGVTTGVTNVMTRYGLPVPEAFAFAASTLELVGGALLLVGLFVRWLGLLYTIEFIIAFFYVKLRLQSFADGRLDLMLLAGAILLFLAGPGRAAVDQVWLEKKR